MTIKKQFILIIALLALVSLMITPVMAETLTGSVGSSGIVSTNYIMGYDTGGQNDAINYNGQECLSTKAIEYNTGSFSLIRFDPTGYPAGYAGTSNITGVCPVVGKIGTATIFTGYFGYVRNFNFIGTEIEGYQYYTFSDWNSSGLTGAKDITVYNGAGCGLLQVTSRRSNNITQFVSGLLTMGRAYFNAHPGGYYTYNKNIDFFNNYTITKPSGIGIEGYVTKIIGGTSYSSKVHVLDGVSGVQLAADQYANTNQFNISTNAQSIRINIYSPGGIWYNSSVLFAPVTPTVTPTPITTIPPGYIQTRVHLMDNGGNPIHGGNINVLDVEANVWTNSTNDADGILYVNTLPYHTLNIYGSFTLFPNEFLPNELLGQETGYEGGYVYWLTLYPYESNAPPGQTSLYVEVRDAQTHYIVTYSVVRIDYNGESYAQNTANSPSALFLVPNNTIIHATASKLGYNSGTIVTNSSSASTKTVTIELSKSTVTPTITTTIPPGGTTPAITVDPHDPGLTGSTNAKGQEMMNWLAMNGMSLVQLCFLVTIMALLGFKFGK